MQNGLPAHLAEFGNADPGFVHGVGTDVGGAFELDSPKREHAARRGDGGRMKMYLFGEDSFHHERPLKRRDFQAPNVFEYGLASSSADDEDVDIIRIFDLHRAVAHPRTGISVCDIEARIG